MRLVIFHKALWLVLAATLCAAGMWTYANRVLIPYQKSEDAAHDRPRGNFSDLYPRWLGARELLLRGRDPYSPAVTREIQQGYYGRPLDSARPGDPKDQQGFAYPVYVIFYLAPTIHLPFEIIRKGFFWVLLGFTLATVPFWLRVLRWSLPWWAQACLVVLTIGSLPVMEGLKLQQMTLLVVALLAIAIALLASDRPVAAGIALALATIKPQLVCLLLLWLTIWTLAACRRRWRWTASFLFTMAILCAASELYLPHWIPRFLQAMRQYLDYTDAASILDYLVPVPWGWLLRMLAVAAMVHIAWKNRHCAGNSSAFAAMISLALAVTLLVIPNFHIYNQVILLPALLVILRERQRIWNRDRMSRVLLWLAAILLSWPWLTSTVLACLSFILPLELLERTSKVPWWTMLLLPVAVVGLILAHLYQRTFAVSVEPGGRDRNQ